MRIVSLLIALALTLPLLAQSPRNTVYGELGGNGLLLTANYERRFTPRVAGRIGLSYIEATDDFSDDSDPVFLVPVMVNFLTNPESNHHLELGGGLLLATGESSEWGSDVDEDFSTVIGTATVGYRYQRPGRGFVFRAGFTPIFDTSDILPWAGVSFGYGW